MKNIRIPIFSDGNLNAGGNLKEEGSNLMVRRKESEIALKLKKI